MRDESSQIGSAAMHKAGIKWVGSVALCCLLCTISAAASVLEQSLERQDAANRADAARTQTHTRTHVTSGASSTLHQHQRQAEVRQKQQPQHQQTQTQTQRQPSQQPQQPRQSQHQTPFIDLGRRKSATRTEAMRVHGVDFDVDVDMEFMQKRRRLNHSNNTLNAEDDDDDDKINIIVAMDTNNFVWVEDLTEALFSFINDRTDGWHDDLFPDGEMMHYEIVASGCDGTQAMRGYWDAYNKLNGKVHGVIGCRCSSSSIAVANIAGLEFIPQMSPSASSAELTDDYRFPVFSRMNAPDNDKGQVGALIVALEQYKWKHVSIMTTNTAFPIGMAEQFRLLWKQPDIGGVVVHQAPAIDLVTDPLTSRKNVDPASACRALATLPSKNSETNTRIVLLFAHKEHSFQIHNIISDINRNAKEACDAPGIFPELIFITPEMRGFASGDMSWVPDKPGILSIIPYKENNEVFDEFLTLYNDFLRKKARPYPDNPLTELPDYAANHMVDVLVIMATALSSLPKEKRMDGKLVSSLIRQTEMHGVSGPVSFTAEGDRKDPQFTLFNLRRESFYPYNLVWADVAFVQVNSSGLSKSIFRPKEACFPEVECGVIPPDTFPYSSKSFNTAMVVSLSLLGVVCLLLTIVTFKYWRSRKAKRAFKEKMAIDSALEGLNETVDQARLKKAELIGKRALLQTRPSDWAQSNKVLNEIGPDEETYWMVHDRMRETMPDTYISKLWRVQNMPLWTYYCFHKDRLEMHDIKPNERLAWHGTSSLDPELVYNDQQDGFMMQFAKEGFWGRGIYFAEQSMYSDCYSYKPHEMKSKEDKLFPFHTNERSNAEADERELFLAKLLVGNAIFMNRLKSEEFEDTCANLTAPPVDPQTNLKYNTVTGRSGGSKIWVVYENGRAYPELLVRYYTSPTRDPQRTPFETQEEAEKHGFFTNKGSDKAAQKKTQKAIHRVPISPPSPTNQVITKPMDAPSDEYCNVSQMELGETDDTILESMPLTPVEEADEYGLPAQKQTASTGPNVLPSPPASRQHPISTPSSPATGHGSTTSATDSTETPPTMVVWEYKQDEYWLPYSLYHREALEHAFNLPTPPKKVILQTLEWTYEVDIRTMFQVNISHPNRTQRKIRRTVVDEDVWAEHQRARENDELGMDDEYC